MELSKERIAAESVREMQAAMERLERREWWRWATALVIMLVLTLGVFSLFLASDKKDPLNPYRLDLALPGLFALVVIFDIFAIYQQVLISRLRRQLSGQIGMLAALEALKPTAQDQGTWKERRRSPRSVVDKRLKVTATVKGKETVLLGRAIDISDLSMAAVLSGSLERGDKVVLEFSAAGSSVLSLAAVIKYVQGFRHGFEFSGLSAKQLEQLRQARLEADPITGIWKVSALTTPSGE
jgi:hypothetical protein